MESSGHASDILDAIQETLKIQTVDWIEGCRKFLRWERQEMLVNEPSPQTTACHRRSLEFLLKMTENILQTIDEPDVSDSRSKADLASMHNRLRESWETFYNPMPPEEVDRILAKAFPK